MDERKYIDEAVSAFRALLEEQIKRALKAQPPGAAKKTAQTAQ